MYSKGDSPHGGSPFLRIRIPQKPQFTFEANSYTITADLKTLNTQKLVKITIVGTGYVGLVTGTCLAEIGHEVLCIDIDEQKIKNLRKGIIPIYEPGLKELVIRNSKEGRLEFSTSIKEGVEFAEVIFSAVGTPPDKDHRADLSAVYAVAKSVGQHMTSYKVFVNKSTVPVGTNHRVAEILKEETKGNVKFDVVDNPEFLREGAAVQDFMNPDRIVVGTESKKAGEVMEDIYAPLVRAGRPLIITDTTSAEIIKYASNAFLATKISFINEVANFCDRAGGDVKEVARGIGLDKRIGPRFLHAGIGYGGSCFPKDVNAFIQTGHDHDYHFNILEAVTDVNESQKLVILHKLRKNHPEFKDLRIAIWGLSFKPKTDDMREAPSIPIITRLLDEGASVTAFDPVAMPNAKKELKGKNITFAETAFEALEGADILFILTEWDEFRAVDLKKVQEKLAKNEVYDGRNIYEREHMEEAGLSYYSIGR